MSGIVNRKDDWMRDLRIVAPSGPVKEYRLSEEELERYRRLPPPPGSAYIDPAAQGAKVAMARMARSSRRHKEGRSEQVEEGKRVYRKHLRETKVTREQLEALLLDEGLSRDEICQRLGIAKSTFWRYVTDWGLKGKMAKAPAPSSTVTAAEPEPGKSLDGIVVPGPEPVSRKTCEISCTLRLNGDCTAQEVTDALHEAASKVAQLAGGDSRVRLDLVVFIEQLKEVG